MNKALIVLFYFVGFAMIGAEMFLPGIIVGLIGSVVVVGALGAAFVYHGVGFGMTLSIGAVIIGFLLFQYALRRLTHSDRQTHEQGFSAVEDGLEKYVGMTGLVETQLRPVGTARIADRPMTVQTRGELLPRGTRIKVLEARSNTLVVAEDPDPPAADG